MVMPSGPAAFEFLACLIALNAWRREMVGASSTDCLWSLISLVI